MRILLLSAYDAHSHCRWREGLVAAFPEHDWTVLTLPPRNFLWRVRGNSLSWAFGERETLMQPYDLVIATSMTDFSALRGMVPSLARVPALVYCHENQFAYPDRRTAERNEPKLVSLYSVLAADCVVFNSSYNRDTFLEGVETFLAKMPDHVPPGITGRIRERSTVIPVPMESTWFAGERRQPQDGPLVLVWNHRWEYDKGPEILFAALIKLQEAGTDFRIHVIGQQFCEQPPVFSEMHEKLKPHIASWGFVGGFYASPTSCSPPRCTSSRVSLYRRLSPAAASRWFRTGWPIRNSSGRNTVTRSSRMMRRLKGRGWQNVLSDWLSRTGQGNYPLCRTCEACPGRA